MSQARQSVFAYSHDRPHAPRRAAYISPATGDEIPVVSPAAELQRTLDEMFAAPQIVRPAYVRGAALTAAVIAAVAACAVFWWTALHWAASAVS